jgi:hypothetical protein
MLKPRDPPYRSSRSTQETDPSPASSPETQPKQQVILLSTRQQMNVSIQHKLILGRTAEVEADGTPAIDLSPFLAYQLGVSRRHLMLVNQDGKEILAFDLSSSNGSFLNGQRLSGHQGHPIHDGDELTLGSLSMRVYFRDEIPFAQLQTRQLTPVKPPAEKEPGGSGLARPVPTIRETLTTQTLARAESPSRQSLDEISAKK